jgi:GxxExxY protein
MNLNEISGIVVDEAYRLHAEVGPGLLESVYESLLAYRLVKRGLQVVRQAPISIHYDGITFDEGFRADLLVEGILIVELKSTEQNHPVFGKKLLTYLRLGSRPLGLLLNFGFPLFKDGIKRVVNNLAPEDSLSDSPRPPRAPREPNEKRIRLH